MSTIDTACFGLRREWLIAIGDQINKEFITQERLMKVGLGNRQADALIIWLRALEYVRKESDGLILTSGFLNLLEEDPTLSDSSSWHKIVLKLIEPSCSLPFIRWYLLHSTRFTNKPREALLKEFAVFASPRVFSTRTLDNAFSSLRDFMTKTPVGEMLGFFKYNRSLISRDPELPSTKVLKDYLESHFSRIDNVATSEILKKTNLIDLYGESIEHRIALCRLGSDKCV
ncbi:hypothetical protein [Mesotoga prima]|uniref:hypothetical protein n=1 Tax=Mesotoga prima TaxID=1184387 RepID=UPI002B88B2C3|nr:hypothetical protein [Mesotoga prima]HQC14258.1 hypothetical protein [Mesotoga prima]